MNETDLLPLMRNGDNSEVEVNGSIFCQNTSSAPAEIRNVLSRSSRVNGLSRDYILTGLDFHDGVTYYVQLISCNGAQMCSMTMSSGLLVDTTPPSRGMFAINTDHAVNHELQRQTEDSWMTWSTFAINLAWLGFADLHSEIDYYMVYVGSSFMSTDVNKEAGQGQRVSHDTSGKDMYDEGKVQTVTIETKKLTDYSDLYITVYAVNKMIKNPLYILDPDMLDVFQVGLRSEFIHSQFERIPGGTLSLKRRCKAITCLGHCVCAPQDNLCASSDTPACTDISSGNPNSLLSVNDVLNGNVDIDYTASNTVLRGTWSIGIRQGDSPLWYQWSVGVTSNSKPEGIFEASQIVWHNAGNNIDVIFTHNQGSTLTESRRYSVFVRAWYSTVNYAIFKSDGVQITLKTPETTTDLGSSVTEKTSNKMIKDEDSIRQGYPITINWQNKFKQAETIISSFKVYLSTYPGGHDVYSATETLPSSTTSYEVRGTRSFVPGVKYYSNVIGYGLSGMHHTESSDGYRTDERVPQAGIVFDGIGLHDLEYQNSSTILEANWHGFTDTGSGVTSYNWCVGLTTATDECNVRDWEKVGLHTFVSRKLNTNIAQGVKIYNKVYAEDSVGYKSSVVVSDGVSVDTTAPVAQYLLHMGENLLQNPSFENSAKDITANNINGTNMCNLTADYYPNEWEPTDGSCGATVSSSTNLAQDGQKFVFIRGGLRQSLGGLSSGVLYRLQFYSSHVSMSSSVIANKEGFVDFGGERDIFFIYNKAYRSDGQDSSNRDTVSWHKHTFYFEALESEVNLTIGAVDDRSGIFIDHMTFEKVQRDTLKSGGDQVSVHIVYLHDWGSIHSAWSFVEDVSHVVDYTWAIGYSVGGTQVQGFRSVGTSLSASNSSLVLVHNSMVYVTVIARNTVDLQSIIYSDPILVDLTAPAFTGVYDGRIIGEDEDAQTENEISVNWEVEDPESGIDYCEWAIGTQANGLELRGFTRVPDGSIFEYTDLDFSVLRGKMIYVTVKCKNKAGLSSSQSSDGVRVSDEKTLIDKAVITPIPLSVTEYRPQDNFQSNTSNIRLKWSGFSDNIPIELYEISVSGLGIQLSEKTNFAANQDVKYADIMNLNLLPDQKEIDILAINDFFLKSESLKTNLTVYVDKPTVDKSEALGIAWNTPNTEFTVSWDSIFSSPYPMYYEVSAGRVKGGGEIVQWLETNATSVKFGLPKSVTKWSAIDVYIMVRAIAAGGRYDDVHGKIKLPSV
ncbi:hypothetical protein FSP39_002877 [Pinctada imbricata]|uniref:Uncharacterized protein n=1 Tax=Pinctada imbricata TaxID=66713 RepID=A0AA88Y9S0_PINIB|nr:hypothetical protein FSP39_002877 [Pinctada imbricata]